MVIGIIYITKFNIMNKLQTVYIPTEEALNEGFGTENFNSLEAFVFTSEELEKVLSDAFNAGNKRGYGYDSETKEEYIENFLNKEK
jgi:hypothetical protein